jgi:hypothetical protein
MSTADRPFRWRSVAVVVFLPTILFSMGLYAIIPVLPAIAQTPPQSWHWSASSR